MQNINNRFIESVFLILVCFAMLPSCNNKLKEYEIFLGFKLGMSEEDFNTHLSSLASKDEIFYNQSHGSKNSSINGGYFRYYNFKIGANQFQKVRIDENFKNGELRILTLKFVNYYSNRLYESFGHREDNISPNNFSEIFEIYKKKYGTPVSEIDSLSQSYSWTKGNLIIKMYGSNYKDDKLRNVEIKYQFDENHEKVRDEEIIKNRNKKNLNDI